MTRKSHESEDNRDIKHNEKSWWQEREGKGEERQFTVVKLYLLLDRLDRNSWDFLWSFMNKRFKLSPPSDLHLNFMYDLEMI